jgi:hypothetical protein
MFNQPGTGLNVISFISFHRTKILTCFSFFAWAKCQPLSEEIAG